MSQRLSRPIESLIKDQAPKTIVAKVDVAIVGSGYGASIAAVCLAGEDRRVVILERGREYALGDFPVGLGELPGHVRFHQADEDDGVGYADALFDIRIGEGIDVLVGSGLGGTSLINANVAVEPDDNEFRDTAWPREIRDDSAGRRRCFDTVTDLLGVSRINQDLGKYRALSGLADALGAKCERAPIAVTFGLGAASRENRVGIVQAPCTSCGNCVTGCNVGAKNTLMMNALPLAHARGAELYTGATALSVMRNDESERYPWILRLRRTASEKTPLQDEVFFLAARDVILGAGTLGSTEILMRSRAAHGLRLSGLLGDKFSGNGDALAFGFAQAKPVGAIGTPVQEGGPYPVGPTITGIVRGVKPDAAVSGRTLTIEDGAVPVSLRRLFGEAATTGAFLHRLGKTELPAWHKAAANGAAARDPIAVADGALNHSQLLLVMGDDGAAGVMELRPPAHDDGRTALDRAHLVVGWPKAGNNPALCAADEVLGKQDLGRGFDGGQYVPNPLWRLLPQDASSVMSGPALGGRAITVHPLGGCVMGDSVHTGVVNHAGAVFSGGPEGSPTDVHDGLHVLDGSTLPKPLGINPFLTIAALSWRAAERLREIRGWKESTVRKVRPPEDVPVEPAVEPPPVPRSEPSETVQVVLRERLIGTVTSAPKWLTAIRAETARWTEDKGLIVGITIKPLPDLDTWLQEGTRRPLATTAKVYFNPVDAETTRRSHLVHTPDEHLTEECLVAKGKGFVWLLVPDDVCWLKRLWRAGLALWAYHRRRQSFWRWAMEKLEDRFRDWLGAQQASGASKSKPGQEALGFLRLAWQHALYRRLKYRLDFWAGEPDETNPPWFTLTGEKLLAWRVDAPRLWDALLNLQFTLSRLLDDQRVGGSLMVDMKYLATTGAPQATQSPHLPATVTGLSAIGMLFARALLQTHFWEFGAPTYPDKPLPRPAGSPPLKVGGRRVNPETLDFVVPLRADNPRHSVRLRLTRYRRPEAGAEPVLLVHGLAQGSLIYSTDTLDQNMAATMWKAGYDVWLVDYRLSNMLPEPVPQGGWSMDDIARYDIPAAVAQVYRAYDGRHPVRIFAHCVGATSLAMGILRGWVQKEQVECVAINAIHPWTMPSPVNDFRARLGTFFRVLLGRDPLDPIPTPDPSATEVILDRLAFSFARYGEEAHSHTGSRDTEIAQTVCDRMTFLYGRMWRHENLDPRTHAALPMIVGPAPGDVYRQLYYFAVRERLTDNEGGNFYLTEDNVRGRWTMPTFFFHGEESEVFNPQSATRSAVRLDRLLSGKRPDPEIPVGVRRVPDFGHMDVVFAKNAHEHVYGSLTKFFADPHGARYPGDPVDPERDAHPNLVFRLAAGPVLRAAWTERDRNEVRVRMWAETDEEVAFVDKVKLAGQGLQEESKQWQVQGCEPRYRLLDATLKDRGPVMFNIRAPEIGSKAEREPGKFDFTYREDLPWLGRLREAARGGQPCRDMRFLVGSCRYPGTPFESKAADRVFKGMERHIDGQDYPGVHMLFFVGDQIYADATANGLDASAWRERFVQRYRVAFTSRHARKVLARVPTHFAIDDHELSDNWSGELKPSREVQHAVQSAKSYQGSGRESFPVGDRQGSALWYPLADEAEHCCPAFVMDTRSERKLRTAEAGRGAEFVSPAQLRAFQEWLVDAHERAPRMPKFVFCGVGIAPVYREYELFPETWRSHDWWLGYPGALSDVVCTIVDKGIEHVVFVSGDLHLSSVSRLRLAHGKAIMPAWQVVSSGLYAPMPFANARPSEYRWNTPVVVSLTPGGDTGVRIEAESGLLCSGPPHFLRLDAEESGGGWTLTISAAGSDGRLIPPAGAPPSGVDAVESAWRVAF